LSGAAFALLQSEAIAPISVLSHRLSEERKMKILKSCNCCFSHKAQVRLMGARARIAYCRSCKARTVWQELSPEALAEREAKRQRTEELFKKWEEEWRTIGSE
jgi:hypothetical protein